MQQACDAKCEASIHERKEERFVATSRREATGVERNVNVDSAMADGMLGSLGRATPSFARVRMCAELS